MKEGRKSISGRQNGMGKSVELWTLVREPSAVWWYKWELGYLGSCILDVWEENHGSIKVFNVGLDMWDSRHETTLTAEWLVGERQWWSQAGRSWNWGLRPLRSPSSLIMDYWWLFSQLYKVLYKLPHYHLSFPPACTPNSDWRQWSQWGGWTDEVRSNGSVSKN